MKGKFRIGFTLLCLLALMMACSKEEDIGLENFKYRIYEEGKDPKETSRYIYEIVVDESLSRDKLLVLARGLIDQISETKDFTSLVLNFYDYGEYVEAGMGPVLGYVEYGPRAGEPKDSKKFELVSYLEQKDWTQRLSEKEAKVYLEWEKTYVLEAGQSTNITRDRISQKVGEKMDLTGEEVNNILTRQSAWKAMDSKK